jgi:hypothetical integral membrane protein (TIGR02206 family)
MQGYPFDTFGPKHLLYLGGIGVSCIVVLLLGLRHLTPQQRRQLVVALAILSVGQELLDDLIRLSRGGWTLAEDLPLHLCSLGMLVSAWALVTKRQLVFEVAYFWGFAAASQALLTPDNSRWRQGELDVFWNFFSHGIIILNVFWLVLVDRMRCRRWSWLKVFLITNLMLIPIALVNLTLDSNYFFICHKPGGDSPFLIGEWPWYLLWFEALAFLFFLLIYLPMGWLNRRRIPAV